ncbi:MAG: magnesium chelatase domain-containing protein [Acidobacteriota bacterium]
MVGGLAVKEPAADLAAAAAMLSAARDRPLREGTVFFGEIGLLGEVRPVAQSGARLREVQQLGFERAVCSTIDPGDRPDGLEILEVEDVGHLAEHCF